MRNKLLAKILMLSIMMLSIPVSAFAAKNWETVRAERLNEARVITRTSEIEVRTSSGAIIISTSRPAQVKVFSILGQLVSQDTIPAGVSQLTLNTHGLFIVKIGDMTCKVAL